MNASPAVTFVIPSLSRTLPFPLTMRYISHCAECPPHGKLDFPGGMRFHSKSNGQRLARSSEPGSRPSVSEISLNATAYLPFGDCHGSSLISLMLTFFTKISQELRKA